MKVPSQNGIQSSNSANVSSIYGSGSTYAGSRTANSGRGDQVQISTLSSVLKALDSQPATQASRITELSSALASGRYQVDSYAVSDKLIQEHMRTAA